MTYPFIRGPQVALSWTMIFFLMACDTGVDGGPCTQDTQCNSSFCVDGVCCESECSGTCQACSALKKGSGANGVCGDIEHGADPDDECLGGACSGAGTCQRDNGATCTISTDCLSHHCIDGVCCNELCDQSCHACSAAEKGTGTDGSCGPIVANTDPNNECAMGNCDGAGVCALLAANGTTCSAAADCASNHCVDGVCCDQDCSDACNACNATGLEGTCILTCIPPPCTGTVGLPDPPIEPGLATSGSPALTTADLNGDGLIDIVTAGGNTISVLLATGNNAFAASVDYPSAQYPTTIIAVDLNGDDKPDLATACVTSSNASVVSVHINNGDGTFGPNALFDIGSWPESMAAADLNGDGNIDLVTANSGSDDLSMLINDGSGSFAPKVDLPTAKNPHAVAAVDLNGDGHTDIATANSGLYPHATVRVQLGNGTGTFTPYVDYPLPPVPRAIVAADFTGDGRPDLAVVDNSTLSVLKNNGNGTFAPRVDYDISSYYATLLNAADTDQDGDLDLVVSTYQSGAVTVFSNQNGSFANHTAYPTPGWGSAMSVVDVTGDGKRDIILGGRGVHVLPNLGNGTFPFDHVPEYGTDRLNPIAVDVNNDGKLDLVAPTDSPASPWSINAYINDGSGKFADSYATPTGYVRHLAAGDFNGDGLQDLAGTAQNVDIWLNQGNNTFAWNGSFFANASSIRAVSTGDFNGDGHVDVAYASLFYSGGPDPASSGVHVLLGNGDGTLGAPVNRWLGGTTEPCYENDHRLATADFDNDGSSEVALAFCDMDRIEIFKLAANGLLESQGIAPVENPRSVDLGDVDGDGLFDLVASTDHGISVFLRQGAFSFAEPVHYDGYGYIALGDFNNDDKLDIVSSNEDNSISLYLGLGNGAFGAPVDYFAGWSPEGTISRDWNGDGRDDLAFNTKGAISVMLSRCWP